MKFSYLAIMFEELTVGILHAIETAPFDKNSLSNLNVRSIQLDVRVMHTRISSDRFPTPELPSRTSFKLFIASKLSQILHNDKNSRIHRCATNLEFSSSHVLMHVLIPSKRPIAFLPGSNASIFYLVQLLNKHPEWVARRLLMKLKIYP
jgi:hypothetical protein